jgi:UDP:flavonoid glycosyltransferase YjiC (YdhE family)
MRHRREEVRPGILYEGFDLAFVVALLNVVICHGGWNTVALAASAGLPALAKI